MITTGRIVNFWGEGHGRGVSASPQSTRWLRPSTSSLWGQHSRHLSGTRGKCESPLDFTATNQPGVSDKSHFVGRFKRTAFTPNSHGITWPDVDSMWTPMYESNQRCNNHNKSL